MAHITRIKAGDDSAKGPEKEAENEKVKNPPVKAPKETLAEKPKAKPDEKKSEKKPFILIRPLVYFFRYLRDSWHEIRQVRWPSRKATWKLFFAIIIYTVIIGAIIMLLDVFFTWLFNTII